MPSTRPVYVVDAIRTPIGKYRGGLARVRPDDLAAFAITALGARRPGLLARLDHVVMGATNQAGEDNRNVARMALLLAGVAYDVPAVTVNRLCGSGLEAVQDAARMIAVGDADVIIAGGVESMTRAPYSMPKASEPFARTPPPVYDTTLGYRYPNPKMAERFELLGLGETAENVAKKFDISRREQDEFALRSHQKAAAAWEAGAFAREVVPVPTDQGSFTRDESIRVDTSLEQLSALPPAFKPGGTVTAGNSSPLNDGAAALCLASEDAVKSLGGATLARVLAGATVGVDPNYMGEGPIGATKKALGRAGLRVPNLDLIELGEAFAAQAIACARSLDFDPARVNMSGGAIALGHPVGASGARIAVTLVHAMHARNAKVGLVTLCVGMGQGMAMLFERASC
jgi:acetyl-CoA acetyltransferase family protein